MDWTPEREAALKAAGGKIIAKPFGFAAAPKLTPPPKDGSGKDPS